MMQLRLRLWNIGYMRFRSFPFAYNTVQHKIKISMHFDVAPAPARAMSNPLRILPHLRLRAIYSTGTLSSYISRWSELTAPISCPYHLNNPPPLSRAICC
jgi:hypothetical protein